MSPQAATVCTMLFWYLAYSLLPAVVISTTSKRSTLRFVCIPFIAVFGYKLALSFKSSTILDGVIVSYPFVTTVHYLNLLLIHRLDATDLIREKKLSPSAGLISRMFSALEFIGNTRGLGTSFQIKYVPPFPRYYAPNLPPGRGRFLIRQFVFAVWEFLLLDLINAAPPPHLAEEAARLYGPGTEFLFLNGTSEQWGARIAICLISIVAARLTIDFGHRFMSIIFVGLRFSSPADWRPLFGNLHDAYTLRNAWGKHWHQLVRWPFTTFSRFITRDVLKLPYPSIFERYMHTTLVFALSGLLHVVCYVAWGLSPRDPGPMIFFPIFAVGILIEDGVQAIWCRFGGTTSTINGRIPLWKRIIGFIWVLSWMCVTLPWFMYPVQRLPPMSRRVFPSSAVKLVGIPAAGAGVALGTLILVFAFGAQP